MTFTHSPNLNFLDSKLERRLQESSIINPITNCWLWNGYKIQSSATSSGGHGVISYNSYPTLVHRLSAYLYKKFDLNSDLNINHETFCLNRNCWNPDHLYIGTQKENVIDSARNMGQYNKLKTHCPKGHEYNQENTYIDKKNNRGCKECKRESRRQYYKNKQQSLNAFIKENKL